MLGGFVILDFGSQVSKLIARRLRELGYYSELVPYTTSFDAIRAKKPKGIILSGGPSSVYDVGAPLVDTRDLLTIAPLFGICYGMQLLAKNFGGVVESAKVREYGANVVHWSQPLNKIIPQSQKVWMSHGDIMKVPPPGFEVIALSDSGHPAAIRGPKVLAVQFHPEVQHTENGLELLRFL
jgi:GMP synthase (glutamine-hydrolysing)